MQFVKDRFYKTQSPDLITSPSSLSSPVASCDLARLRPLHPTAALLQLEARVAPSLLVPVSLPNARAKNICANKAEWVQPRSSQLLSDRVPGIVSLRAARCPLFLFHFLPLCFPSIGWTTSPSPRIHDMFQTRLLQRGGVV